MADSLLTTAKVLTFNNVDMDALVDEILEVSPFLNALSARTATSDLFKYTNKTANATPAFRAVNAGKEGTSATYEQIVVTCKYLDASFWVDVAAADTDQRGPDHAIMAEAISNLQGSFYGVEKQLIKGVGFGGSASGFLGFEDWDNTNANEGYLSALAAPMVIGAGGTGTDLASAYLVHTGEQGIEMVWGQGGRFTVGPRQVVDRPDGTNQQSFKAYSHMIGGYCGLKRGHDYSVARIANLENDNTNGLDDDLIAQAIALFPSAYKPNMIVMGKQQQHRLQVSRTATNPTGTPAPFPESAFGIPIVVTDVLTQDETALV